MSLSSLKLRRKMCKYQNIIMKDYGMCMSNVPTKIIMICNGGLVNGIDQDIIFDKFGNFGMIKNIVMLPGKSYCFVVFEEQVSAQSALMKMNNQEVWPILKGPVYLSFVERLPEALDIEIDFISRPPGLFVLEDFITEESEKLILTYLGNSSNKCEETKSSELKNRKVSHFGYEFKYTNNNVDIKEPIREIPKELDFIWDRLIKLCPEVYQNINFRPDQLTVNNYQPGQGIPAHVDTHSAFEDPIVSLSLQSDLVMEFKNSKGKLCNVLLPARSLCIMSGESRYGWTHAIATRKSDIVPVANGGLTLQLRKERTSLTFRKIRQRDCDCDFPEFCDTKQKQPSLTPPIFCSALEEVATKLEESYVHQVYEKISDHFSETRHKPWPNVLKFVRSLPAGSILVDVGCGNGKYFSNDTSLFELGLDTSCSLMEICRKRGFECFTSNCMRIPLRDDVADGCISIAVIHHLVTEERRRKAIEEIVRILKLDGRALIYVWAKNQERMDKKSSYLKHKTPQHETADDNSTVFKEIRSDLTLPIHTNRTNFVHNDLLVPWKLKSKGSKEDTSEVPVYLRYYHVFEDEELKTLCSSIKKATIIDYYYDQGNWCVMLQKK